MDKKTFVTTSVFYGFGISSSRIMQFISKLPNFSDDFILNSGCGTPYFPPKKNNLNA